MWTEMADDPKPPSAGERAAARDEARAIVREEMIGVIAAAEPDRPVQPKPVPRGPAWRVGRKLGRTLYRGEQCVGMVDTPELAWEIVRAMSGCGAPYETSGPSPASARTADAGTLSPQPAVGPEAVSREAVAGASTVDDEAMGIARQWAAVTTEQEELLKQIRAYRDREVARAREECAELLSVWCTQEHAMHSVAGYGRATAFEIAAKRIRALAAKETKP